MSPLDNRHLVLLVQECQAETRVVNDKTEDSKSVRDAEAVAVSGDSLLSVVLPHQLHRVVWLKHDELQLNVGGLKREPLSVAILLQIDEELNVVFDLIVLLVGALFDRLLPKAGLPTLVMSQVACAEHTCLLERPVDQLFAELEVIG